MKDRNLKQFKRYIAQLITDPFVKILKRTGISPNAITVMGFVVTIVSGFLIYRGLFFAAGWVLLLGGLFDIIDGALARSVQQTTKFGALLDSTIDRLSEGVIFISLSIYYIINLSHIHLYLILAALVGSFLVSYIKARAEGLGLKCEVGWFTRTERILTLTLFLIMNQVIIALYIFAVFTFITVLQRLHYTWRQSNYL